MADQTGLKLRCSCPQEDHAQCCLRAIAAGKRYQTRYRN